MKSISFFTKLDDSGFNTAGSRGFTCADNFSFRISQRGSDAGQRSFQYSTETTS